MIAGLQIDALPVSWEQGPEPGWFRATAVPAKRAVWSRVRAFESLDRNPDYLLDRVGTRRAGPLGRPEVVSLPEPLDDGIALLAFELEPDDTLTAISIFNTVEQAEESNRRALSWIEKYLAGMVVGPASATAGPVIAHAAP